MRIGIGVTTTPNRRALLDECIDSINTYTSFAQLYVHNDENFKGVAYSKNMCLDNLRKNDFIFLFDDDCRPKSHAWLEYLCLAFEHTNENHFLLLNESHERLTSDTIGINKYKECGGVFMAFTKRVINDVGYMDERYKGWGFEHAGYSNRIYRAGLNSHPYLMPRDLNEFIYSSDYAGEKIESSITETQKKSNYADNLSIFMEELSGGKIYKTFKQ